MNKIKPPFFLLVLLISFTGFYSCEKVIEVPLNDADREIVVEAIGRNYLGESYILISRSGSVYNDNAFERLSGAVVTVTDNEGNVFLFSEDLGEPGRYLSSDFIALPSMQYNLVIEVEDQSITAESSSLSLPTLDSLTYINTGGGFGGSPTDTSYLLFYNFVDNAAEVNFYQVSAWVNGVKDENFYIGNDVLGNGQLASAPLFATEIGPKDTVFVELRSMDEASYTYLSTLSSNINSGPFSATPANPVSNLSQGVGLFSVYMVDTMTIIMP